VVPCEIKIWQPGTFVPSSCCNGAAGKPDRMKLKDMFLLLMESANQGTESALAENIQIPEWITKSEAYRRKNPSTELTEKTGSHRGYQ
jgi:hypothetical protein